MLTHGQRAQFRRLGRNYVPQDRRDRSRVMFPSVRNEFKKRPRGMSCTSENRVHRIDIISWRKPIHCPCQVSHLVLTASHHVTIIWNEIRCIIYKPD
jgi:hypothetical protein